MPHSPCSSQNDLFINLHLILSPPVYNPLVVPHCNQDKIQTIHTSCQILCEWDPACLSSPSQAMCISFSPVQPHAFPSLYCCSLSLDHFASQFLIYLLPLYLISNATSSGRLFLVYKIYLGVLYSPGINIIPS